MQIKLTTEPNLKSEKITNVKCNNEETKGPNGVFQVGKAGEDIRQAF